MAADIRITYYIRRWRLRRHLGQAALGAQVGLGASTISAYEHGDVDIPTSRLCRLAQALQVTLNDLVTWTDAPAPPEDKPSA
jgi:transcriptional regulator with XRE-family HTH domain